MISFTEWLSKKKVNEFTQVDPQTLTNIMGNLVKAQQPNSPANVATNLAKTNAQLAAAIGEDPITQKIIAIDMAKKKKMNPELQNINNTVPPNIGTTMPVNNP